MVLGMQSVGVITVLVPPLLLPSSLVQSVLVLPSTIRCGHNHYVWLFCCYMRYVCVSMPWTLMPSFIERWTWNLWHVQRSWCVLCTWKRDRHWRVQTPSLNNRPLPSDSARFGYATKRAPSSLPRFCPPKQHHLFLAIFHDPVFLLLLFFCLFFPSTIYRHL